MKINVIAPLQGFAYSLGVQDMPKEHAQKFLDADKADLPEEPVKKKVKKSKKKK